MPEHTYHIGDIIELKEEFSQFYETAKPGHRAIVKDIKTQDGFLMLYVNWLGDTEAPGWTFASHFEFIRETEDILPKLQNQPDSEDEYIDRVIQAVDAACDSEAFFIIAMKKIQTPHGTIIAPEIYSESNNDTAAFLMEAQLMQIASDMFRNVVTEAVQHFDPEDS